MSREVLEHFPQSLIIYDCRNPIDTYLGKARMSESRDVMPQLTESNDEEDEDRPAKEISATDTGHIPSPSGEG